VASTDFVGGGYRIRRVSDYGADTLAQFASQPQSYPASSQPEDIAAPDRVC
jgi:hypothetical protein